MFEAFGLEYCGLGLSDILNSGLLDGVPKLKHLSLKGNVIRTNESQKFSELMLKVKDIDYLDLSENRMTDIRDDTFLPVTKLTFLNLASNKIKTVNWEFVRTLPDLQVLDMSNNEITSSIGMKSPLMSLTKLASFRIAENPFICSCEDIKDLQEIATMNPSSGLHVLTQLRQNSVQCTSPEASKEWHVSDYYNSKCK